MEEVKCSQCDEVVSADNGYYCAGTGVFVCFDCDDLADGVEDEGEIQ